MAALLIMGETWRSSRSQSKRRDDVDDKLEDLSARIQELSSRVDQSFVGVEERLEYEKQRCRIFDYTLRVLVTQLNAGKIRNDELERILERVVEIGLRGGWAEFEGTPLTLPRIQFAPPIDHTSSSSVDDSSPTGSSRSTSDSPS